MRGHSNDTSIDKIIKITEKKNQLKEAFIKQFYPNYPDPFSQIVVENNELVNYLKKLLPQTTMFTDQFFNLLFEKFFMREEENQFLITQESIDLFFASILNHLDINI